MSIGMILLIVIALLILFGVLQRVLDRMALSDRQALICVAAIFIGGWLPDIPLGLVRINIGGALVPLGVCVYLLVRAGTAKERVRCAAAAAITAAAVFLISRLFPSDPAAMPFDPMILYGGVGGAIAWLLGHSRRSAFVAGVMGIILADILSAVLLWRSGVMQTLYLGGAGALDAAVISGILAVLLCELAGEIVERVLTGKANAPREDGAIEGGKRA